MPIALKIISYQRLTPGQQAQFRSDLNRFSIGRNRDNHWSLPDPQRFMSGTHCWLEARDGKWFLTDTSTNGVYINGSDQRVPKNESVVIGNGDRIRLGDYELQVEIESRPASAAPGPASDNTDPFGEHGWDVFEAPEAPQPAHQVEPEQPTGSGLLGESLSIDALFQLGEPGEKAAEPAASLARQGDQASALEQHFPAPSVGPRQPASDLPDKYAAPPPEIPDNWDIPENWDEDTGPVECPEQEQEQEQEGEPEPEVPLVAQPAAVSAPEATPTAQPPPVQAPARGVEPTPPAPRDSDASALAAFAAGAGLDPRQLSFEDQAAFFTGVGELLRAMTQGVMQAIASRGQIKSELRLEQTMIAPTRNNPLKFSVSAQEALVRLLTRTDSAYLTGPVAAAEAIDDINAHQMAVVAGTEAALKSLLRRFKPATLESRFGGDSALAKALPVVKKAKYWDFYRALYEEVSEAAGDDFQKFFGSEFSDAYEKQLERLKTLRKETNK